MDKEYAKMLKRISVLQDISEVKDSAEKLAERLKMDIPNASSIGFGLCDHNLIHALLDYIKLLEDDLAQVPTPSHSNYMPNISE